MTAERCSLVPPFGCRFLKTSILTNKPSAKATTPINIKRVRFMALPERQVQRLPAQPVLGDPACVLRLYLIRLATEDKTLLAFDPIKRLVPTTIPSITASITAYSAMS